MNIVLLLLLLTSSIYPQDPDVSDIDTSLVEDSLTEPTNQESQGDSEVDESEDDQEEDGQELDKNENDLEIASDDQGEDDVALSSTDDSSELDGDFNEGFDLEEDEDMVPSPEPASEELEVLSEEKRGLQGNWYEKSQWLVKARDEDKEVQDLADSIQLLRRPFIDAYNEIQSSLDKFYFDSGNDKSQIQEAKAKYMQAANRADNLESSIKKGYQESDDDSWYDSIVKSFRSFFGMIGFGLSGTADDIFDEEEYQAGLSEFNKAIDSISSQIDSIRELDVALEKRISQLDSQINISIDESKKSRELYNEIWEIIDHNNARANFFEIKGIKKKLISIKEYVEGELKLDFDQVIDKTSSQMESLSLETSKLKDSLSLGEEAINNTASDGLNKIAQEQAGDEVGFFSGIINSISDFFSSTLKAFLEMVYSGSDDEASSQEPQESQPKNSSN